MNIATILATKGDKVVTARAEQSIREALGLLAQHNIGALVVVDANRHPIGILSERDIVRAAAKNEDIFRLTVSQLMTRNLVLGTSADDLGAAGSTMVERRIRHLPVMDGGKLVGIVTIGDIVKAQRDHFQGEVDTLQTIVMEQGH
ncbi:MAG TPA: CBS domain-containing protein [Methylomirabilota bacterium]|nr:CBS domain-containing protein [Methylomirabilota bacterium]